jgi:hypothetical protein
LTKGEARRARTIVPRLLGEEWRVKQLPDSSYTEFQNARADRCALVATMADRQDRVRMKSNVVVRKS